MAKMGRPKVESPRDKMINIRLTEKEYEKLAAYASANNQTITQVVLQRIKSVLNDSEQ